MHASHLQHATRLPPSHTHARAVHTKTWELHSTQQRRTAVQSTREAVAPYVGPVRVEQIEGAGRGIIACHDVQRGQLLLACKPLVTHTAPPGRTLTPTACVPALLSLSCSTGTTGTTQHSAPSRPPKNNGNKPSLPADGGSPDERAAADALARQQARVQAYEQLWDGGSSGLLQLSGNPVDLHALASLDGRGLHQSCDGSEATARLPRSSPQARALAHRKAQLNAYAEPYQDAAAAEIGREPLQSILGIWPAHALLNHSCLPNASTLVLGEGSHSATSPQSGSHRDDGHDSGWTMMVRVAQPISAGQEVTISYAGAHASSPLPIRRAALHEAFGFRCECERCLIEQDYHDDDGPVGRFSMDVHKALAKLRPQLMQALDRGDSRALDTMLKEIEGWYDRAQAVLSDNVDDDDRGVVECSVTLPILEAAALLLSPRALEGDGMRRSKGSKGSSASTASSAAKGKGKGKGKTGKGFGAAPASAGSGAVATVEQKGGAASPSSQHSGNFKGMSAFEVNAKRLALIQEVAPCSFAAAELSARQAVQAKQELGPEHSSSQAALNAALDIHKARYGSSDELELEDLKQAHFSNSLVDALALAQLEAL